MSNKTIENIADLIVAEAHNVEGNNNLAGSIYHVQHLVILEIEKRITKIRQAEIAWHLRREILGECMGICLGCGEKKGLGADNLCFECAKDFKIEQNRIWNLQKKGHTRHCACRIVWGDGECECQLKKGIVGD